MKKIAFIIVVLPFLSNILIGQAIKFETSIVSNSLALHPMIFDVNKDGKNDIVVVDDYNDLEGNDALNIKTLAWFSDMGQKGGEGYKRSAIAEINYRSCGIAAADIDNDGYIDIIGRYDMDGDDNNETGNMFWLKNPYGSNKYDGKAWQKFDIGFSTYAKDILATDFNRDGKIDIVSRGVDGYVRVYLQNSPVKWTIIKVEAPHHDGTDVADIDLDGDPDIVINGLWYETPADLLTGTWTKHDYAPRWYQQKTGKNGSWFDNNTKVTVDDLDDDGWPDVFISNAENTGYAICWYKNPGEDANLKWEEHVIGYMNFAHTLCIGDMDNDGDKDVISGELIIWDSPNPEGYHPVTVFVNRGNNLEWAKQVISEKACYGGTVGDMDNDGDLDIVAPRNWNKAPLYLWRNLTNYQSKQAENPHFTEIIIDDQAPEFTWMKSLGDINQDGKVDMLAGGWQGGGMVAYLAPDWKKTVINDSLHISTDAEVRDIDKDEKMDIVTNGYWFENTGDMSDWVEHKFTDTWTWVNAAIDVADMNSDGLPDILHSPSELAGNFYHLSWFEAPDDPAEIWKEHIVVDSVEAVLHSIGAADFNSDGKIDIVVAEMQQGDDPDEVILYFNQGDNKWEKQVISTGGSHSMRIFDFDGDGDMDVFGANHADHVVKIWMNEDKRVEITQ